MNIALIQSLRRAGKIMFERYTEKARRVIFFARYEASQFGSPYIETEHLLLGLLRENKAITGKLLSGFDSVEAIRRKIEAATTHKEHISTSVDLPLSNESKRVLAYAAEEAERLSHKHIGSEHLLLGLLREEKSFGFDLLIQEGLTLEHARKQIGSWPPEGLTKFGGERTVEIHGRTFSYNYVQKVANAALKFAWIRREWKPLDLVVDNEKGGICFDVSIADGKRFQPQPGGWTKEPCAICDWDLQSGEEGFTNGRRWICEECYQRFVERKDSGGSSWEST
jgi:hypothetical protein